MNYNRDDHLEDFDSKRGDIEKGSLAATQSSESSRQLSQIQEGIQRGVLQAKQDHHNTSSRSPDNFMQMIQSGGYSVTTGQMNDFGDEELLDTYTFDGSTITSANDITHKKFQKQQQVVQFPDQNGQGYPPIKPVGSSGTQITYSSEKGSRRSEYTEAARAFCCGLGKLGVILISVALTSVAVAVILWLTLGGGNSPSSACCKGSFEPDWSGREICNVADVCCVVCASSISEDGDNLVIGVNEPEEEEDPPKIKPTMAPTFEPEETETPPAPVDNKQTPAPTPAPTPQATLKCCEDAWDVWGDYMGRKRCLDEDPDDCCLVCNSSPTVPQSAESVTPSPTVSQTAAVTPSPTVSPAAAVTPSPTIVPSASPSASPTEEEVKDFFGNGTDEEVQDFSGNDTSDGNGNGDASLPCCADPWDVWGDFVGRQRCNVQNGVNVCCEVCG